MDVGSRSRLGFALDPLSGVVPISSFKLKSARSIGEDARAPVPDQQMRPASPRYPVDRYLVESSKKFEFVNILGDDIWEPEPALRPEDEILLRKLHEMLQSTADDLKALSGEISKFHNPGIQIKRQPMPLDEEFNEKLHIEEMVNAKFHGHQLVDKPTALLTLQPKKIDPSQTVVKPRPKKVNTGVQVNAQIIKKKNLGITPTRCVQINSNYVESTKKETLNNVRNKPVVSYNEYSFKYEQPKHVIEKYKRLGKQDMPSINIRNELKQQKVLQLDIFPQMNDKIDSASNKSNIAVISIEYDASESKNNLKTEHVLAPQKSVKSQKNFESSFLPSSYFIKPPKRKVSKMSVSESCESANPSSDSQHNLETRQYIKSILRKSPKTSARSTTKSISGTNKDSKKRSQLHLEDWKRKLNMVYGPSTSNRYIKKEKSLCKLKGVGKATALKSCSKETSTVNRKQNLNNTEYIPYNKLTLGGVSVSDIEKEISHIPNKSNIPLSPILDKLLTSQKNSANNIKTHIITKRDSPRILTTSDENLLEEVLNLEKNLHETESKNEKKLSKKTQETTENRESDRNNSYEDDFEDEKSAPLDNEEHLSIEQTNKNNSSKSEEDTNKTDVTSNKDSDPNPIHLTNPNKTYTFPNLSLKDSVDIFEFVHSIDTQDTATQSKTFHKIAQIETQTSPRNDKQSPLQSIHNDLWPSVNANEESIDPKKGIEKLFKVEKDLIRKIIIEEYGDLIENNISKPSTSKEVKMKARDKNIYSYQKNTQTSPARVKSVMTSPTRTKTRTTSPFLSVAVDHQNSPMVIITNQKAINVSVEDAEDNISVNLSSPRFSLRFPQSSREVLSCLGNQNKTTDNSDTHNKKQHSNNNSGKSDTRRKKNSNSDPVNQGTYTRDIKNKVASSTSSNVELSSSEISSLGEVKLKLKRKNKLIRVSTLSETSTSSSASSSKVSSVGGIIPLRSEGEVSQNNSRKLKSEGEVSLGQIL